MTPSTLKLIFSRTSGHCHFCGDRLIFSRRGMKKGQPEKGAWEADHVLQKDKGGRNSVENYLPACVRCNRLRWHRKGKDLRELLLLGLIANSEIKKGSETGKKIVGLKKTREKEDSSRSSPPRSHRHRRDGPCACPDTNTGQPRGLPLRDRHCLISCIVLNRLRHRHIASA
jgi:hypothetical protein